MKFAEEFSPRNFRLDYGAEWDFAGTQWRSVNLLLLLAYRISVTIYCVVFALVSIITKEEQGKWLLFITSWNYVVVLLYFMSGSVSILAFVCKNQGKRTGIPMNKTLSEVSMKVDFYRGNTSEDPDKISLPNCLSNATMSERRNRILPGICRINWLFFNLAMNLCIIVVFGYWTAVYNPAKDRNSSIMQWYLRVDRHGINLLWLVIDFTLIRVPVRFFHFIYPALLVFCYAMTNLIYWSITQEAVYSILDYGKRPGYATVTCVGGILVCPPLVHFILYWCHRLKKHIAAYSKARRALRFDPAAM